MRHKTRKQKYSMKGCSNLGGGSSLKGAYNQNPYYPYKGASGPFPGWLNSGFNMHGGKKHRGGSCGSCSLMKGGSCGSCSLMKGGTCGSCSLMKGGSCGSCSLMKGGNNGLPYGQNLPPMRAPAVPNGLTGNPWGANLKWPFAGNYNHFSLNKYVPDVVTAIKDIGANIPFLKGGKRRSTKRRKSTKRRSLKGAGYSTNSFFQDIHNGIRQVNYNNENTLNNLTGNGVKAMNPMPYYQPFLK